MAEGTLCWEQLPETQGTVLKEEKEKVFPEGPVRTVHFIPRAREKREQDQQLKRKQERLKHIQKYLSEKEKGKKETMEETNRKYLTVPATEGKPEGEKETLKSKEFSTPEQYSERVLPSISLTAWEMAESSTDFKEKIMKIWEDAREEPPTVPEEDPVPPKRNLSPRTQRALQEVATCILRHVARKRRGQRDEQADLQDKLKCELAVLQWERLGREAHSSKLGEDGPRPAPPAWPGKRRAGPVRAMGLRRDSGVCISCLTRALTICLAES
ncbi:uncharacterized protein LOC133224330 [Neopsephotus bourkii]|uniref:uncharacterized protein LOC133224330 n=1 Tax=Neopsephotus bourkii TaxID=309878 RepID=UPI002AA5A969|nr:uncharacterized protein LOC133224330 [Neopsephotus bourkii]